MESKTINKLLLITGFILSTVITSLAQNNDYRRLTASATFGYLPVQLSGVMEKSSNGVEIKDGMQVPIKPEYSFIDTTGLAANFAAHIGYILPFYANESWSTGIKLNAGLGYQTNIKATEGLTGFLLDFPQYLYYRNYAGKLDFDISLGYKYTRAALDYHLILGAAEVYFNDDISFGIYGSLNKYIYFMYFTDGREEPMTSIREFGLKLTLHK